jgi:Kdo2-lipid IVA lauroyltransferase/acyltransferase
MKVRRKKRGWKRLWWEIRYWLASIALQGFVQLIRFIPFTWTFSLVEGIGARIAWRQAGEYKKIMMHNLNATFHDSLSDEEKRRIAQESLRNMLRGMMETLSCVYTYRKQFDPLIELEGRKNLEQALAQGNGAIAITAHLGTFTLIGAKLNANGFPNTWILGAQNHPRIAQNWRWMTEKTGSSAIIIDSPISFHKAILRALRKGNIVFFVGDENQKHGGVLVEFLGRPMALPVGPAVYHLKTGAPILPMFIIRQGGRRHKVIIDSPLEITLSGDEERDVFTITTQIARVIESFITQYPDQWSWISKRRIRTRTKRTTFLDGTVNPLS